MTYDPNPVTWAGVVLRMKDGTVHAWEFAEGLDLAEFSREVEEDVEFGILNGFRQFYPSETIEIRLRAHRATYWREGAERARPPEPTRAIADAPREIEAP